MEKNESLIKMKPIYISTRNFLGKKDLVVSFYTKKCKYKCTFCDLSTHSSPSNIEPYEINQQIDFVFDVYNNNLEQIKQISIGNEGSILDRTSFPIESFDYLLRKLVLFVNAEVLSLETRPEYINENILDDILNKTKINMVDVTIGFETQDDKIRNGQLNKCIDKQMFEEKVRMLGSRGVRLTSYVMLKPGYEMSEEDGINEAYATIKYLNNLCLETNTKLVVYLNPTYIAKGSDIKKKMKKNGYLPPKIQSILMVLLKAKKLKVPIYTGLYNEQLSDKYGDYRMHSDYSESIFESIKSFNKNQDYKTFYKLFLDKEEHHIEDLVYREVHKLLSYKMMDVEIDFNQPITNYGLDSLCITMLICKLERIFDFRFEREISLSEFNTINDITNNCRRGLEYKYAERE